MLEIFSTPFPAEQNCACFKTTYQQLLYEYKDAQVLKSTCRKFWCLYACKKATSYLTSFWRYCKDIANLQFWELRECFSIIVTICRILRCLHACQNKLNHSLLSWDIKFQRILHFDWPTTFWSITREPVFSRYRIAGKISTTILVFILDYFHFRRFS